MEATKTQRIKVINGFLALKYSDLESVSKNTVKYTIDDIRKFILTYYGCLSVTEMSICYKLALLLIKMNGFQTPKVRERFIISVLAHCDISRGIISGQIKKYEK